MCTVVRGASCLKRLECGKGNLLRMSQFSQYEFRHCCIQVSTIRFAISFNDS